MSFGLELVESHRAHSVEEFLDRLPEVREQKLGILGLSIHSPDITPAGFFARHARQGIQVWLPIRRIDRLTDNNYSRLCEVVTGEKLSRFAPAFLFGKEFDVGLHIDPTKGNEVPVQEHRLDYHYTPYGSGLLRAARVTCEYEELAFLRGNNRIKIAQELKPTFEELSPEPFEFGQGDILTFTANGQYTDDGSFVAPLMHDFVSETDRRILVVR